MKINLELDELTFLIMLLTQRMCEDTGKQESLGKPGGPTDYTHPAAPLAKKLHDARNLAIKLGLRDVGALGKWLGDEVQEPPHFGGKPGEPVPAVDAEDLKTAWEIGRDAVPYGAAAGFDLMKQAFKPGADIQAVGYRTMFLWMMSQIASEKIARFTPEGQPNDSVFYAAAKVPAEWMGVGIVRQGPPFDVNEFLCLCEKTEAV
jgi:hypothetical protein